MTRPFLLFKKRLDTNYLALRSMLIFLNNHLNHFFTQNSKYLPQFCNILFYGFK